MNRNAAAREAGAASRPRAATARSADRTRHRCGCGSNAAFLPAPMGGGRVARGGGSRPCSRSPRSDPGRSRSSQSRFAGSVPSISKAAGPESNRAVNFGPRSARWYARLHPATPPPTIATRTSSTRGNAAIVVPGSLPTLVLRLTQTRCGFRRRPRRARGRRAGCDGIAGISRRGG